MRSFISLTFLVLGWSWYEMSGGAAFEPGQQGVTMLAKVETLPSQVPEVTRTSLDISSILTVEPTKVAVQGTSVVGQSRIDVPRDDLIMSPQPSTETPAVTLAVAALTPAVVVPEIEYRAVSGNRVNLRSGPGTSHAVVTQLVRGEEVEVLVDQSDGWVKLRALDGNDIGWMSGRFLAPAE